MEASSPNRCHTCGQAYPAETLVCPACKTILATPGIKRRTPVWVIVLLACVIVALLIYISILSRDVFILHKY